MVIEVVIAVLALATLIGGSRVVVDAGIQRRAVVAEAEWFSPSAPKVRQTPNITGDLGAWGRGRKGSVNLLVDPPRVTATRWPHELVDRGPHTSHGEITTTGSFAVRPFPGMDPTQAYKQILTMYARGDITADDFGRWLREQPGA